MSFPTKTASPPWVGATDWGINDE